jgi:hypothetical protein
VRHGRGAGGEVATRRREVGEGPGPVGRLWAADSSPAAALAGGARSAASTQSRLVWGQKQFKLFPILNGSKNIQNFPNFDRPKRYLPELQKFEIK